MSNVQLFLDARAGHGSEAQPASGTSRELSEDELLSCSLSPPEPDRDSEAPDLPSPLDTAVQDAAALVERLRASRRRLAADSAAALAPSTPERAQPRRGGEADLFRVLGEAGDATSQRGLGPTPRGGSWSVLAASSSGPTSAYDRTMVPAVAAQRFDVRSDPVSRTDCNGVSLTRWPPPAASAASVPGGVPPHAPEAAEGGWWCYRPPDSRRQVAVRRGPHFNSPPATSNAGQQICLNPGDAFAVAEVVQGMEGVLYLRLADGSGWLFDQMPGVGVLCQKLREDEEHCQTGAPLRPDGSPLPLWSSGLAVASVAHCGPFADQGQAAAAGPGVLVQNYHSSWGEHVPQLAPPPPVQLGSQPILPLGQSGFAGQQTMQGLCHPAVAPITTQASSGYRPDRPAVQLGLLMPMQLPSLLPLA
eukprot:TRINITY_DN4442_c0_g3_i2.p1 TRINITY_DN4442_c0_g3~~TRINITY_DN4442_c0_g3_i2.p1  ORF type:complete len:418 (-),score=62.38 TRINITY_DN4442_c0_g3_i2:120-1373(-)